MTAPRRNRIAWVAGATLAALLAVLLFAVLLSAHVLARGIDGPEAFAEAFAAPQAPAVLGINLLVAFSGLLFVRQTGWAALRVALTVAAALLIGFGIMLLLSPNAGAAYHALLTGPISRLNRWATWIDDTLALTFVALAIAIVFRAKLFSLGAEGQIFFGALASGLVALFVTGLPAALHLMLALAAGCVAGLLWGLVPGLLRAYLGASELVATLMLNPIAILFYNLILERVRVPGSGAMASAQFADSALLPRLIAGTRVTTALFWAMLAVFGVWLLIRRTPLGYEIRMLGANARFAQYSGIPVRRVIVLAMAISGLLGGLAGSYLSLGIFQRLPLSVSNGLTFEGIVVALLARNNPLAVPAMALLYAYLRVGAPIMQNDAGVSLELVRVIQAISILLVTAEGLVAFVRPLAQPNRRAAARLARVEAE